MRNFFQRHYVGLLLMGLTSMTALSARAESVLTARGLAAFSGGRYAEAAHDWQEAAKTGDGDAALYIGLMNDFGRGVPRDLQAARTWYEQAAAMGNAVAMFNVGVLYDSGSGVPRDSTIAVEWYKKAAAGGMTRAAYALGLIYESGDGVPADKKEAARYFHQALASGATAARAHLASLGEPAIGGHDGNAAGTSGKDASSAKDTGLTAFDRAQELLLGRTPQATHEAAALLRQAADKGDLLAAYDLAYCYEKGIGLQADRQQAYIWYGRAARSTTVTVQRAAQAGMQSAAHDLKPAELAAAKSAVAAPRAAQ